MSSSKIGIDAGGTLIKIACINNGTILYMKFDSKEPEKVVSWVNNYFLESNICITGGKGALLQSLFKQKRCSSIVEFDATCMGIKFLLRNVGVIQDEFILTNVGTGTSIHFVTSESHTRVGGTGVGGGTMIGLSWLLTGINEYSNIVNLAKQGQRCTIDLKVKDIYEGSESPIFADLTASNFGNTHILKPSMEKKDDLLASIIGLVGETVATTSILAAGQCGTTNIVYIGSSFIENEYLRDVVEVYTRFKGANPLFVMNGEYSGAIGALFAI